MRRVVRESVAALALGLLLPFLGCHGTAGRLPTPPTTTTTVRTLRRPYSGAQAVCTIRGYRVTMSVESARAGRWNCYWGPGPG